MWKLYNVKEQIKIRGFYSLFECEYDGSYSFTGESHNFWECVYVLEGSICASGDERVYDLSKNEMIFHKPMELHKFYITSENGARLFIFSFDIDGAMMDFFCGKAFRLTEEQSKLIRMLISFLREKVSDEILDKRDYMRMYINVFKRGDTYSQMTAIMLEQLFLSFYENNAAAIAVNTPETEIFRKAVCIMNSEIGQCLTVSDIADRCHVSSTQLKRIFYKYSSFGVHKYYLKMKINSACIMLNEGMSISEISERLGFCNQNYFSTVFKRETGTAPMKYRKST